MISRKNEHIESLKQQFLDYESTFSYLPEETGKKLIELREKNEFTQNEVADIIGIARNTLSNYEKGKRSLDIITLRKLCKLYNVSSDYLLGAKSTSASNYDFQSNDALRCVGLSENLVNALSGTPDFAYLLNNIYSHKDFQKLASLTFESRYTQYESMNNGYRSFLVSQLLYSILADVFKDWYTDGNGGLEGLRIKEMAPDQIKQLMSEIEEYLQNLKSYSNINITSLEAFDDYETQYDNLKTLYQKLKKYL